MPVRYVWFDLGYTLIYMQRELTYGKALKELGYDIPAETLAETFHFVDKYFMREFPGVFGNFVYSPMPWYIGVANYRLGVRANLCDLASRWMELQRETKPYWLPYPETHPVLEELARRSLGVGLISNWDHTARKILDRLDLSRFLDPIIVSMEVGHAKPSERIFRIALEQAGVAAEQCLYVGDNYYDDALGARKVGMRPLIINRYGRLGIEEI
ncbi:MAG: HAD-IA family hydrolase, partial [Spirochaetales bacterium]|nr:HAD-IA family hydrolase [Spirochaetales bacterium]